MDVHRLEGACLHAVEAVDAFVLVQLHYAVDTLQGVRRARFRAGRHIALAADNRLVQRRIGIRDLDPDRRLLRVVRAEMLDGADQLADMAAGAGLRDYYQLLGHEKSLRTACGVWNEGMERRRSANEEDTM